MIIQKMVSSWGCWAYGVAWKGVASGGGCWGSCCHRSMRGRWSRVGVQRFGAEPGLFTKKVFRQPAFRQNGFSPKRHFAKKAFRQNGFSPKRLFAKTAFRQNGGFAKHPLAFRLSAFHRQWSMDKRHEPWGLRFRAAGLQPRVL